MSDPPEVRWLVSDLYRMIQRAADHLHLIPPAQAVKLLHMIEQAADDIARHLDAEGGPHPVD
jgi:hypothetical protein